MQDNSHSLEPSIQKFWINVSKYLANQRIGMYNTITFFWRYLVT